MAEQPNFTLAQEARGLIDSKKAKNHSVKFRLLFVVYVPAAQAD
jgi:hypothetical protein